MFLSFNRYSLIFAKITVSFTTILLCERSLKSIKDFTKPELDKMFGGKLSCKVTQLKKEIICSLFLSISFIRALSDRVFSFLASKKINSVWILAILS